jgi:hypothetical protein
MFSGAMPRNTHTNGGMGRTYSDMPFDIEAQRNALISPGPYVDPYSNAGLPIPHSQGASTHPVQGHSQRSDPSPNRGPAHIPTKELFIKTYGEKEGLAIWEMRGAEQHAAIERATLRKLPEIIASAKQMQKQKVFQRQRQGLSFQSGT